MDQKFKERALDVLLKICATKYEFPAEEVTAILKEIILSVPETPLPQPEPRQPLLPLPRMPQIFCGVDNRKPPPNLDGQTFNGFQITETPDMDKEEGDE